MNKLRVGWGKYSKATARVSVFILVFLLIIGLIIVPLVASSAQTLFNSNLPIILNNANFGPIETFTPTPAATVTGTLPTPTNTNTAGPSPTHTYTPSPTVTGTLVPNGLISFTSVTGSPAQVNQNLVFTIKVTNNGTGPTFNNNVVDNFTTYLDLLTVTTTQGSVSSKSTRSFTVSVGTVNPGVVVTIVTTVRVNSSLTHNETTTNTATLTYDGSLPKYASITYQVIYQTLPGTGELPLNWREASVRPAVMIPGALLMIAGGILLLLVVFLAKARTHPGKLWMTVCGAILFLVGFVVAITASGVFSSNRLVQVYDQTPTS